MFEDQVDETYYFTLVSDYYQIPNRRIDDTHLEIHTFLMLNYSGTKFGKIMFDTRMKKLKFQFISIMFLVSGSVDGQIH